MVRRIPKQRIYVCSFGCSLNMADGEVVSGCLDQAGHELVDQPRDAEILVYLTCAVKEPTENRVINLMGRTHPGKKLIVAGCLPLINPERVRREISYDAMVGPTPGERILEFLERVVEGETFEELNMAPLPRCDLPKLKRNRVVEIIPISYGCLNSCSYCAVKLARGELRSHPVEDIVSQVRKAVGEGSKEIWLTTQDTASYGRDLGCDLSHLIDAVSGVPETFWIRVGMMNPTRVIEIRRDLVRAYRSEKIYKFLHLPVQSGSDAVLSSMRRGYLAADFYRIVREFRKVFPWLTLSTDVIVGFPGETQEDFEETLKLVREVRPDIVNISKYASRPGTEASAMKRVDTKTVKERSRRLTEEVKRIALEKNQSWKGWEGMVLVDEVGPRGGYVGRNFAYRPVVVDTDQELLGKFIRLKVVEAETTYLKGEISPL